MTSLGIDSCPRSCGNASSRCYHPHQLGFAAASRAGFRIATAWPRLSSWPAPRPLGPCCPLKSWAAVVRPRAGVGSTSGPGPACSSSCRRCCWTSWARLAASIWTGPAWTPSAYGQPKGDLIGANPGDRGKAGSKLHLAGDAAGLPLSVVVSAANDSTLFEAVLDAIPPILMPTGRRRRRPGKVHADKAYDHRRCRAYLRRRGIKPRIARRAIESSTRLGRHRWTIERTGAWLGGFRRLRIRYERSVERFYALVMLACAVICFNTLRQPPW
jgi:transposase